MTWTAGHKRERVRVKKAWHAFASYRTYTRKLGIYVVAAHTFRGDIIRSRSTICVARRARHIRVCQMRVVVPSVANTVRRARSASVQRRIHIHTTSAVRRTSVRACCSICVAECACKDGWEGVGVVVLGFALAAVWRYACELGIDVYA
jgi:hypothetical protein